MVVWKIVLKYVVVASATTVILSKSLWLEFGSGLNQWVEFCLWWHSAKGQGCLMQKLSAKNNQTKAYWQTATHCR